MSKIFKTILTNILIVFIVTLNSQQASELSEYNRFLKKIRFLEKTRPFERIRFKESNRDSYVINTIEIFKILKKKSLLADDESQDEIHTLLFLEEKNVHNLEDLLDEDSFLHQNFNIVYNGKNNLLGIMALNHKPSNDLLKPRSDNTKISTEDKMIKYPVIQNEYKILKNKQVPPETKFSSNKSEAIEINSSSYPQMLWKDSFESETSTELPFYKNLFSLIGKKKISIKYLSTSKNFLVKQKDDILIITKEIQNNGRMIFFSLGKKGKHKKYFDSSPSDFLQLEKESTPIGERFTQFLIPQLVIKPKKFSLTNFLEDLGVKKIFKKGHGLDKTDLADYPLSIKRLETSMGLSIGKEGVFGQDGQKEDLLNVKRHLDNELNRSNFYKTEFFGNTDKKDYSNHNFGFNSDENLNNKFIKDKLVEKYGDKSNNFEALSKGDQKRRKYAVVRIKSQKRGNVGTVGASSENLIDNRSEDDLRPEEKLILETPFWFLLMDGEVCLAFGFFNG